MVMTGGHGHVVPRTDGARARCGGPALCSVCAKELAAQQPVSGQTPGQAAPEPWRAAWLAFRDAAGFDPRADLAPDDEIDPTWRTSWESAARAAIRESPEAAELKRLYALIGQLSGILLQGGQDAASVRREALAVIQRDLPEMIDGQSWRKLPAQEQPAPGLRADIEATLQDWREDAVSAPYPPYEGPIAPEDAALCGLASKWEREAFRLPWMLGEKDPRAAVLQNCARELRALTMHLFRGAPQTTPESPGEPVRAD